VREGRTGIIYRVGVDWFDVPDAVRIILRGGYCAAGATPGDGQTALPDDLREAAIEQSCFVFKRRDDLGLAGVGFEGGSISKFDPMDLLPMVKRILNDYRRPQL